MTCHKQQTFLWLRETFVDEFMPIKEASVYNASFTDAILS